MPHGCNSHAAFVSRRAGSFALLVLASFLEFGRVVLAGFLASAVLTAAREGACQNHHRNQGEDQRSEASHHVFPPADRGRGDVSHLPGAVSSPALNWGR